MVYVVKRIWTTLGALLLFTNILWSLTLFMDSITVPKRASDTHVLFWVTLTVLFSTLFGMIIGIIVVEQVCPSGDCELHKQDPCTTTTSKKRNYGACLQVDPTTCPL
jgi:hypothetical protein